MAIYAETSKTFSPNREVITYQLLDGASTDETTSDAVYIGDAEAITMLIEAGTGVSGGVVEVEAALTSDYAGTWKQLATVTTNAASKIFSASIGLGNESSGAGLPYLYARLRISTVISGGTVDGHLIIKK